MRSGQARDTVRKGAFLTATLIAKAFSLPILLVCKIIDKSRSLALEFNRQIKQTGIWEVAHLST